MNIFTMGNRTFEVKFNGNSIETVREMGPNETYRLGDLEEWTIEQKMKMRRFVENYL